MKLKKLSITILIITISLMISCKNEIKPRILYWSASSFTLNDSLRNWSFYLGYYIELSDTGDVKIMTRKMFQGPKEYYSIIIPDSIKTNILDLAMNNSMIFKTKREEDDEERHIYDGPTYTLRIQCDTIDKTISFIPPEGNQLQKRLVQIMDRVINNPIIKAKTEIDLTEYEKHIEKEVLRRIGTLPKIKDPIRFIPPIIEPEK